MGVVSSALVNVPNRGPVWRNCNNFFPQGTFEFIVKGRKICCARVYTAYLLDLSQYSGVFRYATQLQQGSPSKAVVRQSNTTASFGGNRFINSRL